MSAWLRVLMVGLGLVGTLGCDDRAAPAASGVAPAASRRLPYYDSPDFTPRWDVTADSPELHAIPAFALVDQHGAPFTEQALAGKITVADFFFTSCATVCPRMTDSMYGVAKQFRGAADVQFLSHSVTPESDTVAVLDEYARSHRIDYARWKLVTGPRADIYELGRKAYFVEEDLGLTKAPGDFLHTENFVLVDGRRHLRGIYNSLDPSSMEALAVDIELLRREVTTPTRTLADRPSGPNATAADLFDPILLGLLRAQAGVPPRAAIPAVAEY